VLSLREFHFQLSIGTISVGSITNASALNIGRNFLRDFKSMSKSNAGIGAITGSQNTFSSCQTYVQDPDAIDMCWDSEALQIPNTDRKNNPMPLNGRMGNN
jgi:hypothetical protein